MAMTKAFRYALLAAALSTGAAGVGFGQDAPLSQAEQEAVVKLQSAKPDVPRDAAKRLGELKSRGAGAELARAAAGDPDASVRRAAVVALGRAGERSRIPEMTAVLKDPD